MIIRWSQAPLGLDAALDDTDPWALSVVVRQTPETLHEDALLSVARGVALLLDDGRWDDQIRAWNLRRIRKVVRRAKGKRWDEVLEHEGVLSVFGSASAFLLPPVPVAKVPRLVSKLQVSGLDLVRAESTHVARAGATLAISLNPLLNMTTGKACAQAGHVAHLAALESDAETIARWKNNKFAVAVHPWSEESDLFVRDAGFTEVPPNSVTARGWWLS